MASLDNQYVYDVIIVGAGPCGFATAARLRENHPSALFTDEEQSRYSWMRRNSRRAAVKNKRSGRVKPSEDHSTDKSFPSTLALDDSGSQWMSRWNRLFHKFEISHLRSPLFFHPDPSDRDALLAYIHSHDRTDEMEEITGCVGKEVSKHKKKKRTDRRNPKARPVIEIDERDRKDYFTPSSSCFKDFCRSCRDQYGLSEHHVRHEHVRTLEYDFKLGPLDLDKVFKVRTDRAEYLAKTVVLAIGAGEPVVPEPFPRNFPPAASHAIDIQNPDLLDDRLDAKIRAGKCTNVLVIGGGLTSAQIADLAIRKGVTKVWLLMRGSWKVKPFDVDLSWMSKFKNQQRSAFWSADTFEERLAQVQQARNGGSMTPRFAKLLKKHVQQARLSVHTHTRVNSQNYSTEEGKWSIKTDPPIPDLPALDHIYFATSTRIDVNSLELLQNMNREYPVQTFEGLPGLSDDLMWAEGVPLFVTGKLATLQLGPGAGNLEGARLGAERIAWAIQDLLSKTSDPMEDIGADTYDELSQVESRYAFGIGSKFETLSLESDDLVL